MLFFAERIRSETRVVGAERAARSTIRDRRARSLHCLVRLRGFHFFSVHDMNSEIIFSSLLAAPRPSNFSFVRRQIIQLSFEL